MRSLIRLTLVSLALLGLLPRFTCAIAATPEEIWKSLEKLPPADREKKLIDGAKKEGEMLWYTNSGIENATRYIQAFKKNFPFINAQVWRAKTRQVTQRAISEAHRLKFALPNTAVHKREDFFDGIPRPDSPSVETVQP